MLTRQEKNGKSPFDARIHAAERAVEKLTAEWEEAVRDRFAARDAGEKLIDEAKGQPNLRRLEELRAEYRAAGGRQLTVNEKLVRQKARLQALRSAEKRWQVDQWRS